MELKKVDNKVIQGGFGTFDFYRELTDYELENFDNFMKTSNSEIDYENIDVKPAIKRALNEFEDDLCKLLYR